MVEAINIDLYLLLNAINTGDGGVFDHMELQIGYICQHALQSILFTYFMVITVYMWSLLV